MTEPEDFDSDAAEDANRDWLNDRTREQVRTAALTVYTPEGVDVWLDAPNRALGGETPNDLIVRGEAFLVIDLVHALAEGVIL